MPANRERQPAVAGDQSARVNGRANPLGGHEGRDDQMIGGFSDQAVEKRLQARETIAAELHTVTQGLG